MDQIEHKLSEYEASRPVHGQRKNERQPNAMPGLYTRPELRREGDVRDVTLGGSIGSGVSAA